MPRIGKFIGTERRTEVTRDWREERIVGYGIIGTEFLVGVMKKQTMVTVAQHCKCTSRH